jgi:hypothetical protein
VVAAGAMDANTSVTLTVTVQLTNYNAMAGQYHTVTPSDVYTAVDCWNLAVMRGS